MNNGLVWQRVSTGASGLSNGPQAVIPSCGQGLARRTAKVWIDRARADILVRTAQVTRCSSIASRTRGEW